MTGRSKRDEAIEEQVLRLGLYSDTVFKCARTLLSISACGSASDNDNVEEVYGQGALFALLSPILRERLIMTGPPPAAVFSDQQPQRAEVNLTGEVTGRGFVEVARYVYRLSPQFDAECLPEVMAAASLLGFEELEQAALCWGLEALEALRQTREEDANRRFHLESAEMDLNKLLLGDSKPPEPTSYVQPAGHALRCLGVLANSDAASLSEPRLQSASLWRSAILKAFTTQEVTSSLDFTLLTDSAMAFLLAGGQSCVSEAGQWDASLLWQACVDWARHRKEREQPPAQDPTAGSTGTARSPRKLFAAGARLVTVATPKPAESDVDWQRWLLPVAELTRWGEMTPSSFACHIEALDPMLPELRQVIYAVRRKDARTEIQLPMQQVDG